MRRIIWKMLEGQKVKLCKPIRDKGEANCRSQELMFKGDRYQIGMKTIRARNNLGWLHKDNEGRGVCFGNRAVRWKLREPRVSQERMEQEEED